MHTKSRLRISAILESSYDSPSMTWHQWHHTAPMSSRIGLCSVCARANAASPHGSQWTGWCAADLRQADGSEASRFNSSISRPVLPESSAPTPLNSLRCLVEQPLRFLVEFTCERAHGAAQIGAGRNEVECAPGMPLRARNDILLERVPASRDQTLECRDYVRGNEDGIDGLVRRRCVAAASMYRDLELIDRRHERARSHGDGSHRQLIPQVNAERGAHGGSLQNPIADHRPRAVRRLLGRLEGELYAAGQIECRESSGYLETDRNVPVVAACVHLARVLRPIWHPDRSREIGRAHVSTPVTLEP